MMSSSIQKHALPLVLVAGFLSLLLPGSRGLAETSAQKASSSAPSTGLTATPTATPATTPAPAPAAAPELVPVSRVVGEVSEHIVTSREARMNRALESIVLASGSEESVATPPGKSATASSVLTGAEQSFPAEVSRVLDEWAIYLEAKALSSPEASKAEVARVLKAAAEQYGSKEAWRSMDPSQEELRAIAERKLIVRDFQKLKGSSSLAPVTDSDALQYFRRNRLRFGTVPFAAVRENIKAFLTKQQTDKRLEEWKEVLRRKYKVRNFIAG